MYVNMHYSYMYVCCNKYSIYHIIFVISVSIFNIYYIIYRSKKIFLYVMFSFLVGWVFETLIQTEIHGHAYTSKSIIDNYNTRLLVHSILCSMYVNMHYVYMYVCCNKHKMYTFDIISSNIIIIKKNRMHSKLYNIYISHGYYIKTKKIISGMQ